MSSNNTTNTGAPDSVDEALPAQPNWYALRIRTRLANTAFSVLMDKGFETFLPVRAVRKQWSDRVATIEYPLFPGYLFCRFDVLDRLPVLTTPGLIGIVGAGSTPIPVKAKEITAIQRILQSNLATERWPALDNGARVYLERGPLKGVEGTLTSTDKGDRLVVSVEILQRAVAVEIDRNWVRPVAARPIPQC